MARLKGQVFILGSVLFSVFLLLVFTITGPSLLSAPTNTQLFFSQTLEESSTSFNNALEQNHSSEHIERRLYSYDRFLERASRKKGIEYSAYNLIVLPSKGKAVFINLFPSSLDARLKTGGSWTNQTVAPEQSFSTSFTPGTVHVKLVVDGRNESHSLDAATPKLVKHSVMNSTDESWENTLIG